MSEVTTDHIDSPQRSQPAMTERDEGWVNTTHDWAASVDLDHLADVRSRASEFAPGGLMHLVLEVLAYAGDEAEERGGGKAVVTLANGWVTVADDGRGTDTRVTESGAVVRKPVAATRDLRFFDSPESTPLPDGLPRRGMSVVAALSVQLRHTSYRANGSWTGVYAHGVPASDLTEACRDGVRGTIVRFSPDPGLVSERDLDANRLREFSAAFARQHLDVTVIDATVRFRTPRREEMAIRQRWLADPEFMAYNAGWDVDHPSYHSDTGCIDFPPESWDAWYDQWIGRGIRDYWLVEDAAGRPVGHAHYHVETGPEGRRVAAIGASVHPDRRRRGFGLATFAELIRRLREAGVADLARNEFEAGRTAAIRIHQALGFRSGIASDEVDSARPATTWELVLNRSH